MNKSNLPVVIFGDYIAAYSVIRALSPYGIPMYIVSRTGKGMATSSRFVRSVVGIPSTDDKFVEKTISWIKDNVGEEAVLMVAGDDEALDVLSKNKSSIPSTYSLTFPGWEKVSLLREKWRTNIAAIEAGISTPQTFLVTNSQELEEALSQIDLYPVILKAEDTARLRREQHVKILHASSREEVCELYERHGGFYGRLLIQEYIPGGDRNLLNLMAVSDDNGDLVCAFMNRKVRTVREHSACSLMESIQHDELMDMSKRLSKKLGYPGYINPEYKLDPRDGKLKLMEVNGRVTVTCSHALRCGVNLPLALYKQAAGVHAEGLETSFTYKGKRALWMEPFGDVMGLFINKRYKSPVKFLRDSMSLRYVVEPFYWRDPKVGAKLSWSFIRKGFVKIGRKMFVKSSKNMEKANG